MKFTLTYIKSTKNTHVYGSDDESVPVPPLYIKKDKLSKSEPLTITVEITEGDS